MQTQDTCSHQKRKAYIVSMDAIRNRKHSLKHREMQESQEQEQESEDTEERRQN